MSNPIEQIRFQRHWAEFEAESLWSVTLQRASGEHRMVVNDLDHALEASWLYVAIEKLPRKFNKKRFLDIKRSILDEYRRQALLTGSTGGWGWKIRFVGGAADA